MKTSVWLVAVLAIIILVGGAFYLFNMPGDGQGPNGDNGGDNGNGETMVRVASPAPNEILTSPITVLGEARGNWYFEASFPVRVLDANGRELGIGIAQAEGDWMTTSFVPFRATVRFSPPTTEMGTVVFQKGNPSGLPEHDAEVRVPVRFSQVVSQTRDIKLYFYNDQLDRDSSGNVLCSAAGLVAMNRSIPFTNTPIQDAVRQLLQGPDSVERLTLSGTEFPLPGVSLTGASLSNGVLTLSFNDLQNRTSGGSCRVNILRAQIEATARQFGGVSEVRLLPVAAFQP